MPVVEESIPEALLPEVEASLAWFNRHEDATFEVTGILDPDEALGTSGPRALRLILCGGDRCEQRSFRVDQDGEGYAVSFLDDTPAATADTPVPVPESSSIALLFLGFVGLGFSRRKRTA